MLIFTALPLLFPTGRLPSRRWRPAIWLTIIGMILWMFIFTYSGEDAESEIPLPSAVESEMLERWAGNIFPLVIAIVVAAAVVAMLSVIVRFRHAQGIERLQIKWFTFVITIVIVAFIISFTWAIDETPVWQVFSAIGWFGALATIIFGLPAAIGIAILRYRLYEIDQIINRTLVYATLTALLLLGFIGSVILFQFLLDPFTGGNDLAVAGSTLLVAALFRPVRNRIQQFVDRRFYRQKYDAQRILQTFSVTTRDAVDLDQLAEDLTGIVARTIQPEHVSIWVPADTVKERQQ
jgi:hypothetical protein